MASVNPSICRAKQQLDLTKPHAFSIRNQSSRLHHDRNLQNQSAEIAWKDLKSQTKIVCNTDGDTTNHHPGHTEGLKLSTSRGDQTHMPTPVTKTTEPAILSMPSGPQTATATDRGSRASAQNAPGSVMPVCWIVALLHHPEQLFGGVSCYVHLSLLGCVLPIFLIFSHMKFFLLRLCNGVLFYLLKCCRWSFAVSSSFRWKVDDVTSDDDFAPEMDGAMLPGYLFLSRINRGIAAQGLVVLPPHVIAVMEFLVPGYSAAPGCRVWLLPLLGIGGNGKDLAGLILLLVKRWLQLPILGFGSFEVAVGAALYVAEAGMAAHVFWNLAVLYCVGMCGAVRLAAAGSSGCLGRDLALNFTGITCG
ncbi:hypothetical protein Nepgr_016348 [Nepenthes gracilis]|uniref:Uncharacterized protein n=1 Tax=Nepenthes gracilis TaxID=150966 RepID=A0AAD3SQ96_NEPGR|nr:hypothetical protein Nepgr_016348 [Nepenthes gracilis]